MKKLIIVALMTIPIITHAQSGTLFFEKDVPQFASAAWLFELGIELRADSSGYITEIRYWKWITDLGAHFGTIWINGSPVLKVQFQNESPSGLQVQAIDSFFVPKGTLFAFTVSHNPYTGKPGIISAIPIIPSELLVPISNNGLTVTRGLMGQVPDKMPTIGIGNSFLRDVRWLRDPNQD